MQEPGDTQIPPEALGNEAPRSEGDTYKGLADHWERVVGAKGKEDRANFLVGVLKEKGSEKVFDAGLGIGLDTLSLKQAGFNVTSNEIDGEFRRKAVENAAKESVELDITTYDWRDLSGFESESVDAVVLMGNSLTQLFGRENQLQAVSEFRRILRLGGVLIIDERNYQTILDDRENIIKDPINNFKLRYNGVGGSAEKGRTTYSSEGGVIGILPEITDSKVVVSYVDTKQENKVLGSLEVYPFKRGDLQNLLRDAGFRLFGMYSDMIPGFDPKADFYEYVAMK
ncbi:MAG: methyltransferase domain-containing protein [Candidatus Woykebacteria bacterium]